MIKPIAKILFNLITRNSFDYIVNKTACVYHVQGTKDPTQPSKIHPLKLEYYDTKGYSSKWGNLPIYTRKMNWETLVKSGVVQWDKKRGKWKYMYLLGAWNPSKKQWICKESRTEYIDSLTFGYVFYNGLEAHYMEELTVTSEAEAIRTAHSF